MAEKKCPKCPDGAPDWLLTYGDMTTLLLTFFIMMYNTSTIDGYQIKLILAAYQGLGTLQGGNTLSAGKLAELGNTVMSLPSESVGRALDHARKRAISEFQPEIATKKVRVTEDERGLVISLAGDAMFRPGSAEIDIEETRDIFVKLSDLLKDPAMQGRRFRIEGHTDDLAVDPDGPYPTNWELSTARSTNVLHFLSEYGVSERQFQVAGFADTVPLFTEQTEEARAYNRRVDVIILTEGHL